MDLADEFERSSACGPSKATARPSSRRWCRSTSRPAGRSTIFRPTARKAPSAAPCPASRPRSTDLETGQELQAGEPGMLWINGPNVMQGYLHQPELTAEVIKDGWYKTGDVAFIDEEGFIHITGRESRFSKIGGEMVPHIKIEEELEKLVGRADDGKPQIAVTAVPDEKKGERLIVLHTKLDQAARRAAQGPHRSRPAQPVHPRRRRLRRSRRNSDPGHRQARPAGRENAEQPSGRNGPKEGHCVLSGTRAAHTSAGAARGCAVDSDPRFPRLASTEAGPSSPINRPSRPNFSKFCLAIACPLPGRRVQIER